MPFLYDPDDSDFDDGENASSWSYPDSNIAVESNSSRVARGSDDTVRVFSSNAQMYQSADNTPLLRTSVQDPYQDITTLARSIRLVLDAASATFLQPNQINTLAARPRTLRLNTAVARRTIIDATGSTSRQPRQVMPTTMNAPRLTSRSVERATVPINGRPRMTVTESNEPTESEQYQEARSQQVIERWLIRRERLAQLQAERISSQDSSAEHREETDGAGTADNIEEERTARE